MTRAFSAAAFRARRTPTTTIVRLLVAAALFGAAACSNTDSSTGPTNTDPTGTYALVQIDQKPIPFEIFNGAYYSEFLDYTFDPYAISVTGGELVLQNDGTYHITINATETWEGRTTPFKKTADGTYRIQGTTITMDESGTGTLRAGNVITLALEVAETGTMRQYAFRLAK